MTKVFLTFEQVEWNAVKSYRLFATGPLLPKTYIIEWLIDQEIYWKFIILVDECQDVKNEVFKIWGLPCIEFDDINHALLFKLSV